MAKFQWFFLIFGGALIGFHFFMQWWVKNSTRKMHEKAKRAYSDLSEYQEVKIKGVRNATREFGAVDLGYYDEVERVLTERGFRYIGDFEDLSITRQYPAMRAFLRRLQSSDGNTMASIFDVKPRSWFRLLQIVGLLPKDLRSLDLECEFTNGTFLTTCIGDPKYLGSEIPGITRVSRPHGTPASVLLDLHEKILADWKIRFPEYVAVPKTNVQEIHDAQNRMRQLKNEHKARTGYVTREDLQRISGDGKSEAADMIMSEIEKIAPPKVRGG